MTLPMALFVGSASVLHCIASVRITALRCFLACFVLLVMSVNSAASWRTTMVQAGVQESIADAIIRLGYDEEGLFRAAFVDQQAFEGWLNKLRHKIGDAALAALSDEDWGTHPHAARLRMLWKSGMPVQPPSTLATPDALALVPAGSLPGAGTKLTAAGREQMRRKLEKDYSSCVVTRETLRALCFLQSIHQQAADKFFEWLPWRRILSEEQLLEVKARRSRSTSDGPAPDEWDMELAGAALRVQQTLETRAHAFAMVSACHLHSWVVSRRSLWPYMLENLLRCFGHPQYKKPKLQIVLSLKKCFSCAYIVVDRDMLRHVLIERPKVLKAERVPRRTGGKRQLGSAGLGRQAPKRVRNGECWLWVDGKCANPNCRFKHEYAVCGDKSHHAAVCPQQQSR